MTTTPLAGAPAPDDRLVLLTGATGFVGRALYPALEAQGWRVRCMTRDAARAAKRWPDREWVSGDVADAEAVRRALDGCAAAFYLVHGMASGGADFRQAEIRQATTFAQAAHDAGVRRIVYLGGVAAPHDASEHLKSRQEVGDTLRAGKVTTIELRASMIVGHGSLSWLIVRDLAARLPIMVLPRWLESRTQPVAIADVVSALIGALRVDTNGSQWFDVPGPDVLSGREILERTAMLLGLRQPVMIEVPFLTPRLSSHWVRFVTRADWSVAREVVVGLKSDLLATDDRYWTLIRHTHLLPFDEAARRAIAEETRDGPIPGVWGKVERIIARVNRAPVPAAAVEELGTSSPRTEMLATAAVLLWMFGAWMSQTGGIWLALGATAVCLGALTLAVVGRSVLGRLPRPADVLIGATVGLAMTAATYALFAPVAGRFPLIREDVAQLYLAFGHPGPSSIAFVLPLIVACEEVVWRGVVFRALAARVGVWPAAVLGSALYAIAHAPVGLPALVLTCLCVGLCWNAVRASTGGLAATIVAHLLWDVAVLVVWQLVPAR